MTNIFSWYTEYPADLLRYLWEPAWMTANQWTNLTDPCSPFPKDVITWLTNGLRMMNYPLIDNETCKYRNSALNCTLGLYILLLLLTVFIYLVQVLLRTEVLRTPSSTRMGIELMTSRLWQYISCHPGCLCDLL